MKRLFSPDYFQQMKSLVLKVNTLFLDVSFSKTKKGNAVRFSALMIA